MAYPSSPGFPAHHGLLNKKNYIYQGIRCDIKLSGKWMYCFFETCFSVYPHSIVLISTVLHLFHFFKQYTIWYLSQSYPFLNACVHSHKQYVGFLIPSLVAQMQKFDFWRNVKLLSRWMPLNYMQCFLSGELRMILEVIFINSCIQNYLLNSYYVSETIYLST